MKLRWLHQKAVVIGIAVLLVGLPVVAGAADVVFPVSAYTPEELAKVRAWEKTWVGKKIDKNNIDQVADFMPESFVGIYKDPEKWGTPPGEPLYFNIVPYKQIIETQGMIAATQKYAPLVKTDANGTILNYTEIAGFPFPNPKTGLEVAYNTECQSRGDTYKTRWYPAPVVDPRQRTDRTADQQFTAMYFIHRTELDEKPVIKKNPKGFHRGQFLHFYLPPEMNNSRMIAMKFIDESKDYMNYLYYGEYRRIRRLSSAERTNAIDGTDLIYDDGEMYDGYLSRNTYTLKGKKEMLLSRNQDMTRTIRATGQAQASNYSFERCNTYVIEVKSKEPDYLYSKRIWYVDPETYWIHWQEIYDQLGRHWKSYCMPTQMRKTETGEMKNFMIGFMMHDFQRMHSGHTNMQCEGISMKLDTKIFLLSNLQQSY